MKCPFTHTGCDKECFYYIDGECLQLKVLKLVAQLEILNELPNRNVSSGYMVKIKVRGGSDAGNSKKGKREKTLEDSGEGDRKGSGVKRKPRGRTEKRKRA